MPVQKTSPFYQLLAFLKIHAQGLTFSVNFYTTFNDKLVTLTLAHVWIVIIVKFLNYGEFFLLLLLNPQLDY